MVRSLHDSLVTQSERLAVEVVVRRFEDESRDGTAEVYSEDALATFLIHHFSGLWILESYT